MKTPKTDAYWAAFRAATGHPGGWYDVVEFGDSAEMMNELAALVAAGTKRATAGLLRDFASGDPPVPRVGDHAVVIDGQGNPVCIYRCTGIRIGPLSSVDERFAWDEGEGDRSRAWWLDAHRRFFTRQAAREGFAMHDEIETVFERFTVIWPPELADPAT
jgi:uncharacterized protein YhfF